jgi:hypothetical protein
MLGEKVPMPLPADVGRSMISTRRSGRDPPRIFASLRGDKQAFHATIYSSNRWGPSIPTLKTADGNFVRDGDRFDF